MAYLAEHRTNREIAGALVLSLNPVKRHSRQFYGELSASVRRKAVQRAGELALLGTGRTVARPARRLEGLR